ncbi:MAG TPA: DNA internalization-related competence protein ComEC/Rec2 [Candidatus Saccharimonadia bacterium]|nr:DNA internalization-related competence protein ComEC/Rec2 [Candidatus Saccharimonadia bacterium]
MPARYALASPPSAAALLAGTLLVHLLPALPPAVPMLALALGGSVVALAADSRAVRIAAVLALGFGWCAWHAAASLAVRIPAELEGRDLKVRVETVDLPRAGSDAVRFDARLLAASLDGRELKLAGRVRLSWYGRAEPPVPGSRLALVVRLKRPRGVVNPGGFDFERFALERRYAATGYVRSLVAIEHDAPHRIDAMRAAFARVLRERFGADSTGALLAALAVGDQSALSEEDWHVLRATGTAHLIAISGMHVGIVAGLGALLARGMFLAWPALALRTPRRRIEAVAALAAAGAYSLVAGMSLPVQRTLLMIAVVLLATWLRRAIAPSQGLALALVAVLLFDPLSALGAGFWLSFVGVAFLIFCLGGRAATGSALAGVTRAQWAMTIGLLPLTAWFFQQTALAGPLANLAAVPWISFAVVPLLLLALGAWLVLPVAFAPLAQLAAWAMQGIWHGCLEPISRLRLAEWFLPEPTLVATALAVLGAFVLLLPRAVPGRALGAVLLAPLAWPLLDRPGPGQIDLRILDVGQGLSVLATTAGHALLYDAGPKFRSGFDMGDAAVVPALRALGVARLDRLVVSHGDSDHAGGADSVVAALRPAIRDIGSERTRCRAGERWSWDGVAFEFLHPPAEFPELGNDSSCVLRIATGDSVVLLPGDVSAQIEARLVREQPRTLAASLLVSPHHGSRSSSSEAFVTAVAPRVVVHSTGHRNRFGHPAPVVAGRYHASGVLGLDTSRDGAVHVRLDPRHGIVRLDEAREIAPRYWRE